jgi:hypothetical protein
MMPMNSSPPIAPLRLMVVRTALCFGAFAVIVVEVLSALDMVATWTVILCWLAAIGAVAPFMIRRRPWRTPAIGWVRRTWRTAMRVERIGWGLLGGLLFAEVVVALLAPPNNFDSQTYHLARIEHWVANGNVEFYPTAIARQVDLPPGAEYLLAHVRLLAGGDRLDNLVQFAAGLVCLAAATRIAAQLGGGRHAQLITAVLIATTPMVVMQSTSTQTDLVIAAWTACLATLVVDCVRRRARLDDVLLLGLATGLTAVTKTTGLLAAGPLLVMWGVAQLRLALRRHERVATSMVAGVGACAAIILVATMIAGPYLARMTVEFGNPLGPTQRRTIPMQRHDPAAVLINALRIGQTALDTPFAPLRRATLAATRTVAGAVGVDINDPAITFVGETFPVRAWYPDEDRVSFPISGTLALVACAIALVRPRRAGPSRPVLIRWYAAAIGLAGLGFVATVKWQSSGNRLLVFLLVLATPVAGVWLEAAMSRPPRHAGAAARRHGGERSVTATVVVVALASSVLAGFLTVGYGFPRRLVGVGSVFTTSPDGIRFLRRPLWLADYRWAAQLVEASGARRVGIVESSNDWEYPWWVFLGHGRQIISLRSTLLGHPAPAADSVDAIVCTSPDRACRAIIPRAWSYARHGIVVVAIPLHPTAPEPGPPPTQLGDSPHR